MRICIITKHIPPAATDGIPRNRWEYARQFVRLGHEVHIITSGHEHTEEIIEGVFIHYVPLQDKQVSYNLLNGAKLSEHTKAIFCYSYIVYQRIAALHALYPIDIIESGLWEIEGYVTKLLLPQIPMAVRLETTSMLIEEIKSGQTPIKEDLNQLETHFLEIADGYISDSWSIAVETERLYQIDLGKKPGATIYHGISGIKASTLAEQNAPSRQQGKTKVLIAGRMEKRKGTDLLLRAILTAALTELKNIEFHFAGHDNAEWDGFKKETGFTYRDYIKTYFPKSIGKQIYLHGYVTDEGLNRLYEECDIVLALSRYESFGLLYVEAIRHGKPLIVFATGAAAEIFQNEEDALLIQLTEPETVITAIKRLQEDSCLRKHLIETSLRKLSHSFTAERMGSECIAFFSRLVQLSGPQRIVQVMNSLTEKDGVSNISIDYDTLLKSEGLPTQIIGSSATPPVRQLLHPLNETQFTTQDIVYYHYWNYCQHANYFNQLEQARKVLLFHNITPARFFKESDEAFAAVSKGFKQLGTLDNFDVYAAFSNYSLDILKQAVRKPITTFVLPPLIDKEQLLQEPFEKKLLDTLKKEHPFHLIFVGRIAPNKKQTDLVRFFHYYLKQVNRQAHLTLVGGGTENYLQEVRSLIKELGLGKNVTISGKVSNEELYAYYRSASVYLSMSEHEGFGVPLAEAMAFDVPVVAYACTAVPETVGMNNCLFPGKDYAVIASLVENLRTNSVFKENVLSLQQKHIQRYSRSSVLKAFNQMENLLHQEYSKRIASSNNVVPKSIF